MLVERWRKVARVQPAKASPQTKAPPYAPEHPEHVDGAHSIRAATSMLVVERPRHTPLHLDFHLHHLRIRFGQVGHRPQGFLGPRRVPGLGRVWRRWRWQ